MKFTKIDERWVAYTDKHVVYDYIQTDVDTFDECVSEEVVDVCSGKRYGLRLDWVASDIVGEKVYHLTDVLEDFVTQPVGRGKVNKKYNREHRVYQMCGVHWTKEFHTKKLGKNRRLRRRMWPNAKQMADYNEYLPF